MSHRPYHRASALPATLLLLTGAALPLAALAAAATAPSSAELHAWEGGDDPGSLERWVHERLQRADAALARLGSVKGAHTVANTLRLLGLPRSA